MIKLNSLQITTTGDCQKENMILSYSGSPLFGWLESGVLTTKLTNSSVWYPSQTTTSIPSSDIKMGLSGENYLIFYLDSTTLKCVEYSISKALFYSPVIVAENVICFDVTENSDPITVVYSVGNNIYTATRDEDSRIWNPGQLVFIDGDNITSVSIDMKGIRTVIAFTTNSRVYAYQIPEDYSFPSISLAGIPSSVIVRMKDEDNFDLIYNVEVAGNNSIEHVGREGSSYWQSQIANSSNNNYNIDLFVSESKAYVVWVEGGYVRYRERDGYIWSGLTDSVYVAACDADSTPRVIFFSDYARVVYKSANNMFYAGMIPISQTFDGSFNGSVWGESKQIENENTGITSSLIDNRLSQRVKFQQQNLSIGGISCYLKKITDENNVSFAVVMDVYYSDINGNPYKNPIATSSIQSSDISSDDWYEFPFNVENMLVPIDGYCFVLYQTGGNENNYASWMFYVDDGVDARISKDKTTWSSVTGLTRSLKVRGNFNAYEHIINDDPSQITDQLSSPPATEAIGNQIGQQDLASGTFENTYLKSVQPPSYYQYPIDQDARIYGYSGQEADWRVLLEDKNLLLGFVVDSSGSMGWNDVFDIRKLLINSFITKLKGRTQATVLFDFVKFGGELLDDISVSLTQKVQGVVVDINDTTDVFGFDQDGNPITDDGNPKGHLATGVVAFGYRNLNGTTYQIYGIDLGWKKITHTTLESNWHSFWTTGSPTLSIQENGPAEISVLNAVVSSTSKNSIRYFAAYDTGSIRARLEDPVSIDDQIITVSDVTGIANQRRVNILDPSYINNYFEVTDVDDTLKEVTFTQKSYYDMAIADTSVETVRSQFVQMGWENTDQMEFFVVDSLNSGAITFFIQTLDGATLEYSFIPMTEWVLSSLYYLDETATFEVDAVNSMGENMPDGTLVEFYVDVKPSRYTEDPDKDVQKSYYLTKDAVKGTQLLYLTEDDMANFKIEDAIDVTDDTKSYTNSVGSGGVLYTYVVEVNSANLYIKVSDPLPENFLVADHAKVVIPGTVSKDNNFKLRNELDITSNMVNVTPIYTGRKLDESYFNNLDTPQVEPTDGYDDHNFDITRVKRNSIELLTTNGYSALRMLPVTEDHFLSPEFKEALSKSLFSLTTRQQVDKIEKEKNRGNVETTSISTTTTTTTAEEVVKKTYWVDPPDFVMDPVQVVSDGQASTTMKSFATELSSLTVNEITYLAKKYQIYTVMTFFKKNGIDVLAQYLLPPFDVYFACPIAITTTVDKTTDFICTYYNEGEETVVIYTVCGDYATGGDPITITYQVDSKKFPLTSGELEIYIYDKRRDQKSAFVLDEDLGDVSGCGDDVSVNGGEMLYSAPSPTETIDEYDESIQNMLLADDYLDPVGIKSTQIIKVTNGIATLTLPALDRIAQFEVHAIYRTGNTSKVIHKQMVYYRSPLGIQYTGPAGLSGDGNATYNLSVQLTWMGTDSVNDGTIVNFSTHGGSLSPSVSETVNSVASGVIFKPNMQPSTSETEEEDSSFQQTVAQKLSGEKKVETRSIDISSSYNGYFASTTAVLKISEEGDEQNLASFFFVCRASPDSFFADGLDYTIVVADLQASMNRAFPFIDVVGPDLYEKGAIVLMYGSGLTVEKEKNVGEHPLTSLKWKSPFSPDFLYPPAGSTYDDPDDMPYYSWSKMVSNQYLGRPKFHPVPEDTDGPPPCNGPECIQIGSYTSSPTYGLLGTGIDSYTCSFMTETISGGEVPKPLPRVNVVEPLGIDLSFEPVDRSEYQLVTWRQTPKGSHPSSYALDNYNSPLKRDGEAKYYVVAEVTWRDSFVFGTEGNPFPTVSFKSGKCVITSNEEEYSYAFTEDSDYPIDTSLAEVAITRTSFDSDHFHECYVDENGNGETTATIVYTKGATVSDHIHTINIKATNVVSYESYDGFSTDDKGIKKSVVVNHTHIPRSVAIIQSGPVSDVDLELSVRGDVVYDNGALKTDGTRVSRTLDNYCFSRPSDEVIQETEVFEEQYFLEVITPQEKVGTSLLPSIETSTSKSDPGSLFIFHAWKEITVGEETQELPLPDGTRIFTTFKFFEPEKTSSTTTTDDVLVIQEEEYKDYAVLEISARLSGLPVEVVVNKQVLIRTDKNWFPLVDNPVFEEATDDSIYLEEAVNTLGEFGGSQINDALILMSNRMIQMGSAYDDWVKAIVLISDGSENMSENSHDQATEAVDSISGDNEVNIFSVKLFDTQSLDYIMMQKYASKTGGESLKIGQISQSVENTVDSVINSILESDQFKILSGKYTNVIDLGSEKMYKGIRFGVNMEPGTTLKFRVRFSSDGINYGPYYEFPAKSYSPDIGNQLQWYILEFTNITSFGRYMEYEVTFKGSSSTFNSPMFAGIKHEYYEPGRYVMFFQPIEIDQTNHYVGEIMFVHEGTVPSTSELKYGITHDKTTDYNNYYYSENQPLFGGGVSGIVLSRYNEKTTTLDYKTYTAINGGWNDFYDVAVYRVNSLNLRGELVSSDIYSINNKSGNVTFSTIQPMADEFTLVITLKPYFRVSVDMKNYTKDTIILDNLTFSYNLVNRDDLSSSGDHRDVSSLVKTDYSLFNVNSSGSLVEDYAVANSNVGKDTDTVVDLTEFETRYYLSLYNGTKPYLVEMEQNMTVVQNHELVGSPDFFPISCCYEENYWYFVAKSNSGCIVYKFDKTFNFVNSSEYVIDFTETGSTFLRIRKFNGKWYLTEEDKIHVLNKAFFLENTILLPSKTSGPFYVTSTNFWIEAKFNDLVWNLDLNGTVKGFYQFVNAQIANNMSYLNSTFFVTTDSKLSRLK